MKKRSIIIAIIAPLIIILIGCVSLFSYYKANLSAVDANNKEEIDNIETLGFLEVRRRMLSICKNELILLSQNENK